MTDRPALGIVCPDTAEVVNTFVAGLQAGHDQRDADILNRQFPADVIDDWWLAAGQNTPMRPGGAIRTTT